MHRHDSSTFCRGANSTAKPEVSEQDQAASDNDPVVTSSDEEPSFDDGEADYERAARAQAVTASASDRADPLPTKLPDGKLQYSSAGGAGAASAVLRGAVAGVQIDDDFAAALPAADATESTAKQAAHAPDKPNDVNAAAGDGKGTKAQRHGVKQRGGAAGAAEARFQARLAELQDAAAYHTRALRVEAVKQQIAAAGSKLLEAPQEHVGQLRLLLELGLDSDSQVRLALACSTLHNRSHLLDRHLQAAFCQLVRTCMGNQRLREDCGRVNTTCTGSS